VLAELHLELFRVDCREGLRKIMIAVALLRLAGFVAAGTAPIALMLVAEGLVQTAHLSRAAAIAIAAMSDVIVALAMRFVAGACLRGITRVFERSREKWTENMTWIKHALRRSEPVESRHALQPQER
jgi:hypothetical protein